jgi:hypothetical protein
MAQVLEHLLSNFQAPVLKKRKRKGNLKDLSNGSTSN